MSTARDSMLGRISLLLSIGFVAPALMAPDLRASDAPAPAPATPVAATATTAAHSASGAPEPGSPHALPAARPNRAERGRELYRTRCASCHGAGGRGDGPIARSLDPLPRDLVDGTFKLRSTPNGSLPSDLDLFRTLTRGMPGTAMPGWGGLPAEDRWALVDYVKSLSTRFADMEADDPVEIPPQPPATPERIARGREVYAELECAKCHGPEGRGDGPSAHELVDDKGERIRPFDFTRSWKLKAGMRAEDLYRVLLTGLGGTPMPAYEANTAEELWPLVLYVQTLAVDREP